MSPSNDPTKEHRQPQQMQLPMFVDAEPVPVGAIINPADIKPSTYQEAIFDFVLNGQGDGVINAVAGAGKTWVLVQAAKLLKLLPGPPVAATFAAFNRHIADNLSAKLRGTPMKANTIHGIGYGCLMRQLGKGVTIDDKKYAGLARQWVERETHHRDETRSATELSDQAYALVDLLKFTRLTLTSPTDQEALKDLAIQFDITTSDFPIPGVAEVLRQGEEIAVSQKLIDFTDMLWLPLLWELQPPQVDFMFVDEAQDLSPAQLKIVLGSRAKEGRMLFVGDPAQSIMAFAGADANSFWNIKQRTSATELPLSICYRCPTSHIAVAQKIVPHIQARPDAPLGIIDYLAEEDLAQHVTTGDLIICRMTAPLVSWCIKLIQAGIYARVRGVDVGAGLITIAKRVSEARYFEYSAFDMYLNAYEAEQRDYLSKRKNTAGRIQSLKDKCEALLVCFRSFPVTTIEELCSEIRKLFSDDKPPVWLSTIHRAKGLENDTVYILYPHKLPLEWKDQQRWEWEQELNLRYVAVTRAKQRLVILQSQDLNVNYEDTYIEQKIAKKNAEYAAK